MSLVNAAMLVRHAAAHRYAVVQINTNGGTYDITRAIIEMAEEENAPVILGAYENNLKYRGYEYAAMQMRFFSNRSGVTCSIPFRPERKLKNCDSLPSGRACRLQFISIMAAASRPAERRSMQDSLQS